MERDDALERGRLSHADGAWRAAHEALALADGAAPLGAEDLELLATAAYMLGRGEDYLSALQRAHHLHLDAGRSLPAARCAIWVGIELAIGGEVGRATGWLGRAQRLVARERGDCVEQGYLMLPLSLQRHAAGDHEGAIAAAAEAAAIGERFGDADLLALALHEQGHCLVVLGRLEEGLALLDEAMVAVVAGELSPIATGIVYCGVILGCQEAYAIGRAQEWTAALTTWCDGQPEMVAFTGRCLVHRAEIMLLRGDWAEAQEEARRAAGRPGMSQGGVAQAIYLEGEVHRLRGSLAAAEEAYRDAAQGGWEPQPGLALLRLAQGNGEAAAATIRRALGETGRPLARARLLPACIEIMLAVGDAEGARGACRELREIGDAYAGPMLGAMVAQADGAVALAGGDAPAALVALRRAWRAWDELGAPYEAARARLLLALACRALGDEDAAALELEAARAALARLGAVPDLVRVDSLAPRVASGEVHGLTQRELQVLRMVAAGETNRAIAAELVLSERTVDRHVSNIFTKLRVSSRAAATAYAYEHRLV